METNRIHGFDFIEKWNFCGNIIQQEYLFVIDVSLPHFHEAIAADIILDTFFLHINDQDGITFQYMLIMLTYIVMSSFKICVFFCIIGIRKCFLFTANMSLIVTVNPALKAQLAEFVFTLHHLFHKTVTA